MADVSKQNDEPAKGVPIQVGLLGNGIGRSRAKHLHELIGALVGCPIAYRPMDLAGAANVRIADALARCQAEGFTGVNVTHPYKVAAYRAVHRTTSLPTGLTSINTVVFSGDERVGSNTDCSGFLRAFQSEFGVDASPGRVLIAGAGGVGKAIAFALRQLDVEALIIHDTSIAAMTELVSELRGCGQPARAAGDLIEEMSAADGLVNATPIGMHQYPGCVFPLAGLNEQTWAFDAVYTPERTEFLEACRQRGIHSLSGFKLFLYQGLDAFRCFTGIDPDVALIEREFLARYPLTGER